MTATSLPEDYPYVHRADCVASDLIDLTMGKRVGPSCVILDGETPVYVGVVMYRRFPYVVRPQQGLAGHVAAVAGRNVYCRFLL